MQGNQRSILVLAVAVLISVAASTTQDNIPRSLVGDGDSSTISTIESDKDDNDLEAVINDGDNEESPSGGLRKLANYLEFGNQCEGVGEKTYLYEADIFLESPVQLSCSWKELYAIGEVVNDRFDAKVNEDRYLDEISMETSICKDPLDTGERRLRSNNEAIRGGDKNSRELGKFDVWAIVATWFGDGRCKLCPTGDSDDDTGAKERRRLAGPKKKASSYYSHVDPYHNGTVVNCGGPEAPTCGECPELYSLCAGDCIWSSDECIVSPYETTGAEYSLQGSASATLDWSSTLVNEIIPALENELEDHLTNEIRSKFFYDWFSCLYYREFRFEVRLLQVDDIPVNFCDPQ